MTHALASPSLLRPVRLQILSLMILAGLLLLGLPRVEAAAPFSAGQTVVVTTDVLNVRAAPGTGNAVVDRLSEGDTVTICAVDGSVSGYDWVQVSRTPGVPIGWVAAEYLGYGDAISSGFAVGDRVLVDAGALNFRRGPSITMGVIRPLPYATLLTITDGPRSADGYTWFEGRTRDAIGGETGWVIGEALMRAPADMPDPCLQYDAGTVVHVTTDTLRLRGTPSMSGAVLGSLPMGTTLTVTGMPVGADGYTWYPVTTGSGTAGWVAGMYIAGGGGSGGAVAVGSGARVDASSLNFRTGPGLGAGIQGQLSSGTWLMVVRGPETADGYHWYQVETANGATGWVIGEALVPAS